MLVRRIQNQEICPATEEHDTISYLENCAVEIKTWMDKNRLQMNEAQTEFIIFGSKQQLEKCVTSSLHVSGEHVKGVSLIIHLGANLDENLSLKKHIKTKCKTAMWNIQRIKSIRNMLTKDACETLILGLVLSHLDY